MGPYLSTPNKKKEQEDDVTAKVTSLTQLFTSILVCLWTLISLTTQREFI
jgi:hypothetical protein